MRITSWNFLHGQVLDPTNSDSGAIEQALNQIASDVIALQEVDYHLPRTGASNQMGEVATLAKAKFWGFAPAIHGTPGVKWRKLRKDETRVITNEGEGSNETFYGIGILSYIPVKTWLRLELGKSLIGMPLAVANDKGKLALLYVKDEPRVALAAVLDNGWTVINTHLSFVPLVNIYQLLKLSRWAKKIEREHQTKIALVGDFNLPWGLPTKVTRWKRATNALSYPSWGPKVSFDYILLREENLQAFKEVLVPQLTVSDHRPITIESI